MKAKTKRKEAPTRNVQAEVTARIIESLKSGTIPWRQPWKAYAEGNAPRNAKSGRPYSGGNVILLWATAQVRGYSRPLWLTYGQATELGGNVLKGERGTQITFVSQFKKPDEKDPSKLKTIPFLRTFTVFNVAQCENLPEFAARKPINEDERDALCEDFIKSTGATIHHGGSEACYMRVVDRIAMPVYKSFVSADRYYGTLFHELAHWTGAEKRLNRIKGKRFGDREYAYEELVAELTSAFACAEFGFDNSHMDHSASYIASWIKTFEEHETLFLSVASEASKAINYMRGLASTEAEHSEEEVQVEVEKGFPVSIPPSSKSEILVEA